MSMGPNLPFIESSSNANQLRGLDLWLTLVAYCCLKINNSYCLRMHVFETQFAVVHRVVTRHSRICTGENQ